MTFLRNLAADLVEKKLWPIAAALVVALVAIPVALGGSGGPDAAPAPAPAPAATAGPSSVPATAQISVAAPQEQASQRAGRLRDPFVQPASPGLDAAKDAVADAVGKAITPESSGSAPVEPATTKPSSPAATPKSPAATRPAPKREAGDPVEDRYRVALHFGTTTKPRRYSDVQPLTALPDTENPVLVFLGVVVRDGERRARFLVSSDVEPSGDGICKPSKAACEALEVREDDTALLDRAGDDGDVKQYQLDVVSLRREDEKGKVLSEKASSRSGPERDRSSADVRDDASETALARLDDARTAGRDDEALYWWWVAVALELQRQKAAAAKALEAGDERPARELAQRAGWSATPPAATP